jgi:hypothetical protein
VLIPGAGPPPARITIDGFIQYFVKIIYVTLVFAKVKILSKRSKKSVKIYCILRLKTVSLSAIN